LIAASECRSGCKFRSFASISSRLLLFNFAIDSKLRGCVRARRSSIQIGSFASISSPPATSGCPPTFSLEAEALYWRLWANSGCLLVQLEGLALRRSAHPNGGELRSEGQAPRLGPISAVSRCGKTGPARLPLSGRASRVAATIRPGALAVLRLIARSNFVGCATVRSAGLAPFKIMSTKPAISWAWCARLAEYAIDPPLAGNTRLIENYPADTFGPGANTGVHR
jgi:hypothetical protein